jgi:hypothetical protein
MRLDILKALNAERAARRAAVVITDVATGAQRFVAAADVAADPLRGTLESHLRSGKSGMEETAQGRVFLTVHVPPPRLVVTGAVHISQALAPVARLLGYDITIVDPRTAFASPERFPDVKLIPQWPDEALPPRGVDPRSQNRRSGAAPRAFARLLLYRRARLEEDTRAPVGAAQDAGRNRSRTLPHPRTDRSCHRGGIARRDCGRHHGRDYGLLASGGALPTLPRPPPSPASAGKDGGTGRVGRGRSK